VNDNSEQKPEILTNNLTPNDSTVVVDEKDRTVILTEDETIIIQKEPKFDLPSKNRPRHVNLGMFGRAEIALMSMGILAVLAVVLFYMFVVTPSKAQLRKHEEERRDLDTQLKTAHDKFGTMTTTQDKVNELVNSVADFETNYLPVPSFGRTELYQRINSLIATYGLVNTTGPDYVPLDAVEQRGEQNESEKGRAKFASLFPGVYVTMTVEGPYQNLRRFMSDMETSRQFVVISAVELRPAEGEDKSKTAETISSQPNSNMQTYTRPSVPGQPNGFPNANLGGVGGQPTPQTNSPKAPKGKMHGESVSLHLEMAAYFRRGVTAVQQQ
jgi:hypothetical protein